MIIALPEQTIIDIASMSKNGAGYAFYLAIHNSLSPTDVIISGQVLQEPKYSKSNYLSFEQLLKENNISILNDIISYPDQSLLDIATQEDGNALALFEWAIANQFNPTDDIIPGQKITKIYSSQRYSKIANYFKGNDIKIATAKPIKSTIPVDALDYYFPGEFPFSF